MPDFELGVCVQAVEMYKKALRRCPNKPSTYTALAFTYHLMRQYDTAINLYHKVSLPLPPPPRPLA